MLQAALNNPHWHSPHHFWSCLLLALMLHLLLLGLNGLWPRDSLPSPQISRMESLSSLADASTQTQAVAGLVNRSASGNQQSEQSLADGKRAEIGKTENINPSVDVALSNQSELAEAAGKALLLKRQAPIKVFYSESQQSFIGRAKASQLSSAASREGHAGEAKVTAVDAPAALLQLGPESREDVALLYIEGWRRWMRANGNLMYPAEARRLGLRGEVLTLVRLNSDGSLADVRILRSSGQRLLDQAVLQTSKEARWYLPFPAELAARYQQLEFSWRWRYGAAP